MKKFLAFTFLTGLLFCVLCSCGNQQDTVNTDINESNSNTAVSQLHNDADSDNRGMSEKDMLSELQEVLEIEHSDLLERGVDINNLQIDTNYYDETMELNGITFSYTLERDDGYSWLYGVATFRDTSSGWTLSEWSLTDQDMPVATSFPYDEYDAYEILANSDIIFDDWVVTESEIEPENAHASFDFEIYTNNGYMTNSYTISVSYHYTMFDGWTGRLPDYDPVLNTTVWNVSGIWEYSDNHTDITLHIINIYDDTITFEFEYSCDEASALYEYLYKEDGTQTANLSPVDGDDTLLRFHIPAYDKLYTNTSKSITVWISALDGVSIVDWGNELFRLNDSFS